MSQSNPDMVMTILVAITLFVICVTLFAMVAYLLREAHIVALTRAKSVLAVPQLAVVPPRVPKVIIIEGIIAAGKTALAIALDEWLRAQGRETRLVLEPVGLWEEIGILARFYADPTKWAYSFQTFAYATRVMAIERACRDASAGSGTGGNSGAGKDAPVIILERSPETDRIFMSILADTIDPIETAMYRTWCGAWQPPFTVRDCGVVFLDPTVKTCMQRLQNRDRPGEIFTDSDTKGVTSDYQTRLRMGHEALLLGEHADKFPELVPGPFQLENIMVLGCPESDLDFRSGPARDQVLTKIAERFDLLR